MTRARARSAGWGMGFDDGDRYPWVAMGVVLIGTFMVILDTTIVNVALPQIGIALGRSADIEWVVTAYLLAVGLAQPPTGWLADRFGRKRVFILSLAFFVVGSLASALSPNLGVLVGARVVQGLGGGALMPVGMAIIYELFPPHRRGTALGIWGVAAMAGPAFGPVIGGYLVTNVSWHWLFLINVPIGLVGGIAASRLLRDTGYSERRRFDGAGLALASVALVVWLYSFARTDDWGWGAPRTVGLLLLGAVFAMGFVALERRIAHPAIDVSMFRVPVFTLTLVVIAGTVVVQFGILVFLPMELETVRGLTALETGTMLVPMALAAAVTFPLGGRLTDRIGPRVPVVTGALLLATSAWILGHLRLDSSVAVVEIAVTVQGLGFGLAMMPNSVTGLNALPRRFVAQATAVRQLNTRVAASFGVAVLASLLTTRLGGASPADAGNLEPVLGQTAFNTLFVTISVVAMIAALVALMLPGKRRNREIQAERAAEYRDLAPEI